MHLLKGLLVAVVAATVFCWALETWAEAFMRQQHELARPAIMETAQ